MDNECSTDLNFLLVKTNGKYELVPPYHHCGNSTKNSISTSKNHLSSGLAAYDENFPIHEWDRLLL